MVDYGCDTSGILLVKLKFLEVKVCIVVVYGLTAGDVSEKERFWNDLKRFVGRVIGIDCI